MTMQRTAKDDFYLQATGTVLTHQLSYEDSQVVDLERLSNDDLRELIEDIADQLYRAYKLGLEEA